MPTKIMARIAPRRRSITNPRIMPLLVVETPAV
jgi:hypothetical protein